MRPATGPVRRKDFTTENTEDTEKIRKRSFGAQSCFSVFAVPFVVQVFLL